MKKLIQFIVITCLFSWAMAAIFYLLGFKFTGVQMIVMGTIYMFIPMTVALFLQKIIYKQEVRKAFWVSFKFNKWFLMASLIPVVVMIASIFVSLLFPNVSYSNDMSGIIERFSESLTPDKIAELQNKLSSIPYPVYLLLILVQGVIAGATINALAAFGEEMGWRGLMLSELRNSSFLKASLIIGFIWGIWHFPLILMGHNYPTHNIIGVPLMIVFCILLTPLHLYITIKSKSVIASSILHGTINGTAGLSIFALKGGSDLSSGVAGFPGMIVLIIAIVLFFIYDKYVSRQNIMSKTIQESLDLN